VTSCEGIWMFVGICWRLTAAVDLHEDIFLCFLAACLTRDNIRPECPRSRQLSGWRSCGGRGQMWRPGLSRGRQTNVGYIFTH
jgi:hypothetical protein